LSRRSISGFMRILHASVRVFGMGTKVLISEEEYLRSSYGNPEPEFRDGELIERPMPTLTHGELIVRLAVALHGRLIGGGRLITATDVRVRIQPGLVRLPDFLVYIKDRPPEIPTEPPFIVVETTPCPTSPVSLKSIGPGVAPMSGSPIRNSASSTPTARNCIS
jgi:hypothetical protein